MTDHEKDPSDGQDGTGVTIPDSPADRNAMIENILQLLVDGRIAIRIENVEATQRDAQFARLAIQPPAEIGPAQIGLGRRLAQAAISWCFLCRSEVQIPVDRS